MKQVLWEERFSVGVALIDDQHKTLIITQNGEAKVVVQDLESYENTKESLALLKMLAQSSKSKKEGQVKSAKKAFKELRSQIKELK